MSAFLGPIHYWLYNKIQLQQSIVDELYAIGEEYGLSLEDDCNNHFGNFENKPLEEMIDHGNIHGWLQERVSQVEYKYAYCVTALLNKSPETKGQLNTILYNKGNSLALDLQGALLTAADVYKVITDNLLDGMPCDHANRVLKQGEDELVWTRNTCVHSRYWEELDGEIQVYYELRDSWINGLVKGLGFIIEKPDSVTYHIKKA